MYTHGILNHAATANMNIADTCLLQLMKVRAQSVNGFETVNVLWDGGSTLSLITFDAAKRMNLEGTPTKLSVIKVGGVPEEIKSQKYDLLLYNNQQQPVAFRVYGMEKISTKIEAVNVDGVLTLFKNVPKVEIERPRGQIDVLIGFEYAGHHPVRKQNAGNLLLLANQFGKCLAGSHPEIRESAQKVIQHVTINHLKGVHIEEFFNAESLGIQCSPKCGSCRCGKCAIGGKDFSLQEERELKLIEEGLSYQGNHWESSYPWIRSPSDLPDNRAAAFAMLRSTEKRLQKNIYHAQMYKSQIDDMIIRGVARKLSRNEIDDYDGPTFYIPHHEVIKRESESTPCRIVFNTSAKFNGHIINDYWAKGPTLMRNLLGVIIRFREEEVAVTGDIKKM